MEILAVSMIRALGRACFESGATGEDEYDIILRADPDLVHVDVYEDVRDQSNIKKQGKDKPEHSGALGSHQEQTAREIYGQTHAESRHRGFCIRCRRTEVTPFDFRDESSRREFQISGFCQKCQDEIFGAPQEPDISSDDGEEDIPF